MSYKDGVRTSVFWRKLVTGSEYDVQFKRLKKEYAFGVGGVRQRPGASRLRSRGSVPRVQATAVAGAPQG